MPSSFHTSTCLQTWSECDANDDSNNKGILNLYTQKQLLSTSTSNEFAQVKRKNSLSFSSTLETIPEDALDSNTPIKNMLDLPDFCSQPLHADTLPKKYTKHPASSNSTSSSLLSMKSTKSIELRPISPSTASFYTSLSEPRPLHVSQLLKAHPTLWNTLMNALEPGVQRDAFTDVLYLSRKHMADVPWVHRLASFLYDVPPILDSLLQLIGWVGGRLTLKPMHPSSTFSGAVGHVPSTATSPALRFAFLGATAPFLSLPPSSPTTTTTACSSSTLSTAVTAPTYPLPSTPVSNLLAPKQEKCNEPCSAFSCASFSSGNAPEFTMAKGVFPKHAPNDTTTHAVGVGGVTGALLTHLDVSLKKLSSHAGFSPLKQQHYY